MDWAFWWAIVFAVVAIIVGLLTKAIKGPEPRPVRGDRETNYDYEYRLKRWKESDTAVAKSFGKGATYVLLVITMLFLGLSSFTKVDTNTIGIMTSFGRPVDALPNGMHLKAPWQDKTQFEATRQFIRFEGEGTKDEEDLDKKTYKCVRVRLSNNATACINGVLEWQMRASTEEEKAQAVDLFKNYKEFSRVSDKMVWQSVGGALNAAFGDHNPLVKENNRALTYYQDRAKEELTKLVAGRVNVIGFTLQTPDYDDVTDKNLAALQAELAKTETAKQQKLTADEEAKRNAAIANSIKNDPGVLVSKCLDIAKEQSREPGYCMMSGVTPIISGGPKPQ